MTDRIRFGIVGLDHWYSAIPLAKSIAAHPDAELVAIAHSDLARAQEVASQVGNPRTTNDLTVLLDDPGIDVIASFVSVDQNPDIVVKAAGAGKHIVSVKPLALSLAEASRMVEAVNKAGVVFIGGESRSREAPQNQLLKELVSAGRLGKITSAQFSLSGSLPKSWPDATDPGWWADEKRAPGGGWIDHSLYQIDRMRWLLGAEVADISGQIANLVHTDIPFEDYGHAILRFTDGTFASIEDTWSGPTGGWRISTSIVGTKGSVVLDTTTGQVGLLETGGSLDGWVQFKSPADHTTGLESILAAVREPASAIGTVEDSWENYSACVSFYEAARTHTIQHPLHLK